MHQELKFPLLAVAGWFWLAIIFGLTGVFESVSAPVVALTVWTLAAIVLLGWWKNSADSSLHRQR